jgi:hypothetical protein
MLASVVHLDQRSTKPPLTLRLLRGAHRGAERACRDRDIVIIGSADDCDLVLSGDLDVYPHHCIVTVTGGALQIRALDGPVTIAGKRVSSGEPVLTQAFDLIELGHAVFALGPSWSDRWKSLDAQVLSAAKIAQAEIDQQTNHIAASAAPEALLAPTAQASAAPPKRVPLWSVAAAFAGLTALAAVLFAMRTDQSEVAMSKRDQLLAVQAMIDKPAYQEVRTNWIGKRLRVEGIASDAKSTNMLRDQLSKLSADVDFRVQSAGSVADQVRELLKVSGVNARSEYIGDKTVRVTGHFADGKALGLAIGQSAMQDVLPGLKISAVNLDTNQNPLPTPLAEPAFLSALKGMRAICTGASECFVQVGAAGNTYFIGSELPGGGTLVEADRESIVVEFELNRYIVRISDLKIQPYSTALHSAVESADQAPAFIDNTQMSGKAVLP